MDNEGTKEIFINIKELVNSVFEDAAAITPAEIKNLEKYIRENSPEDIEAFKISDDETKKLVIVLSRMGEHVRNIIDEKARADKLEIKDYKEKERIRGQLSNAFTLLKFYKDIL